ELALELFLARIDQHLRTLTEHQLLDFQEAPQLALEYLPCVQFVYLTLVDENHPEDGLLLVFAHETHIRDNMDGTAGGRCPAKGRGSEHICKNDRSGNKR